MEHLRTPFKVQDKLKVIKEMEKETLITPSERHRFKINCCITGILFPFIAGHNLRLLLSSLFPLVNYTLFSMILFGVFGACLWNVLVAGREVYGRMGSVNGTVTFSQPKKDNILQPPKSIAREALPISNETEGRVTAATPYGKATFTPYKTPAKGLSIPTSNHFRDTSATAPTFLKVYGTTPVKNSLTTSSVLRKKEGEDIVFMGEQSQRLKGEVQNESTALPDTGLLEVNRMAAEQLPHWTELLKQKLVLQSNQEDKSLNIPDQDSAGKTLLRMPRERTIINAEMTLRMFGLTFRMEEITERLCKWFCVQILKPLINEIDEVNEAFYKAGMDHLSCNSPASFSLFTRTSPNNNSNEYSKGTSSSNQIIITTNSTNDSNINTLARPQTLIELSQKYSNDPLVIKRLRIERYLSFASHSGQRTSTIRKIREMSENGLVKTLKWPSSKLRLNTPEYTTCDEEALILLNLFCSFMDERLPSEDFYDSQPFSAVHFVDVEGRVSDRLDAIQIQQINRHPLHLRLVAGDKIYEVDEGPRAVFYAIIIFTEYISLRHKGYLGIANLSSSAIALTSIL